MSINNVTVREGTKSDCKEIRRLIQELADFEEMPEGPRIGYEKSKIVGYALYFWTYSTWNGRKINLEDLYVSEKYRQKQIGSQLFKSVAKKAIQAGCNQLEFTVLAWNPARKFYERLGAINFTETEQWNTYRLKDEALRKVAQ